MEPPSIGRIIRQDWMSFALAVLATVWAVGTLGLVTVRSESNAPPAILLLTGIACLLILGHRVGQIRRAFTIGQVVTGRVVVAATNFENDHYVIAAYEFGGRKYRAKAVTEGTGRSFRQGDLVEMVVDPAKPSRAYIVSLFA
jgi:hypothetical protein